MSTRILQPILQPILRPILQHPGEVGGLRLGPELVPNGDFSGGATGWNLGAGWEVVDGELVATAAEPNTFVQSTTPIVTAGETYFVQISCIDYVAGGWKLIFEGGVNATGDKAAGGIYTGIATATVSGSIYLWSNFLLTANFDNISVRKLY